MQTPPRLAVRGLITFENRVLLVNAYGDRPDRLWCLPGGGVEAGASLPDNLAREVWEECGLRIKVRHPLVVSEFQNSDTGFHQVEVIFRGTVASDQLDPDWHDPERVVSRRRFASQAELQDLPVKPDLLKTMDWDSPALTYEPLHEMLKL
ncbi:MAG TPA: NUDIX hydrolase [Aliiroseovarius sp.]|nr:NUDIX hydrolase [Aliiroseovarius sp.]